MEAVSLAFGASALQTPQFVDCSAESMRNAGVDNQVPLHAYRQSVTKAKRRRGPETNLPHANSFLSQIPLTRGAGKRAGRIRIFNSYVNVPYAQSYVRPEPQPTTRPRPSR